MAVREVGGGVEVTEEEGGENGASTEVVKCEWESQGGVGVGVVEPEWESQRGSIGKRVRIGKPIGEEGVEVEVTVGGGVSVEVGVEEGVSCKTVLRDKDTMDTGKAEVKLVGADSRGRESEGVMGVAEESVEEPGGQKTEGSTDEGRKKGDSTKQKSSQEWG